MGEVALIISAISEAMKGYSAVLAMTQKAVAEGRTELTAEERQMATDARKAADERFAQALAQRGI